MRALNFPLLVAASLTFLGIAPAAETLPKALPIPDTIPEARDIPYPGTLEISVDATDLQQRIYYVKQTLPVSGPGKLTLMLPKWIPAKHRVFGSIRALAGLTIRHRNKIIPWKRDDVEVYAFHLDVAGRLVEVISGQPYDEFLRTRIFEPLCMKDTQFYLSDAQADRLVTVQTPGTDGWEKYIGTDHYDADYPIKGARTWFGGGAGLTSTVRDYAAFLQMYLNGGEYLGTRLLSRTTIETIMAFQTELTATKYYSLAFGVVTPAGVAHGGLGGLNTFSGGGYFNSSYFADPEEKVLAMIFKQTRGQVGDQTAWKFAQMTFAAIDD
jgi:hypothetical protein